MSKKSLMFSFVEDCSTEDLEKLAKKCEEKQKKGFSLYLEMIYLSITHELSERRKKN